MYTCIMPLPIKLVQGECMYIKDGKCSLKGLCAYKIKTQDIKNVYTEK
jgi:hypothetical protein